MLVAEDKLDDGNPIVLQVTINVDEVSSVHIFAKSISMLHVVF